MFGSLTGIKAPGGTDWGEQAINTVVSQSIRHLFSKSESVEIAIRCYPSSKLLQGVIDSFKMSGKGLVIRKDFPVEQMSFETDAVSVDFASVLSGQLRLKQPTQAVAQVVLSEEGINRAFTAELVTRRLRDLDMPALTEVSGGKPVSFADVQVELLPENQIQLTARAEIPESEPIPICLKSTVDIERRRRIKFTAPLFELDKIPEPMRDRSERLSRGLIDVLNNMVDLDRFDLDGVMMRLNRLQTKGKELIFSGYAQIEHFPRKS
mgnify:CR=1 FL=1